MAASSKKQEQMMMIVGRLPVHFAEFGDLVGHIEKGCAGCAHKIEGPPSIRVAGRTNGLMTEGRPDVDGYIKCKLISNGKNWVTPISLEADQSKCASEKEARNERAIKRRSERAQEMLKCGANVSRQRSVVSSDQAEVEMSS